MIPQAMLVYALPTEAIAGQRLAIALAVILLVDQVAVARHQQPAVLAAARRIVEGPVELLKIHARRLADLAPASSACAIRRRNRAAGNTPARPPPPVRARIETRSVSDASCAASIGEPQAELDVPRLVRLRIRELAEGRAGQSGRQTSQ